MQKLTKKEKTKISVDYRDSRDKKLKEEILVKYIDIRRYAETNKKEETEIRYAEILTKKKK